MRDEELGRGEGGMMVTDRLGENGGEEEEERGGEACGVRRRGAGGGLGWGDGGPW